MLPFYTVYFIHIDLQHLKPAGSGTYLVLCFIVTTGFNHANSMNQPFPHNLVPIFFRSRKNFCTRNKKGNKRQYRHCKNPFHKTSLSLNSCSLWQAEQRSSILFLSIFKSGLAPLDLICEKKMAFGSSPKGFPHFTQT